MWPFNREKTDKPAEVPTEIQEYYQSSQRERRWVAWALAAVTLVVTVGVVLGAFFGGRAIYHKVAHKDKPVATTNQPSSDTSGSTPKPKSSNSSGSSTQPTNNAGGTVGVADDSTSKNVTATNQPVPNTGPGETAAIGFVSATAIGIVLYQWRLRRKFSN